MPRCLKVPPQYNQEQPEPAAQEHHSVTVTTGLLISPVSKTERGASWVQGRVQGQQLIRSSSLISSPSSEEAKGDNSHEPQLAAAGGGAAALSACRVALISGGFVCSVPSSPALPHPLQGARGPGGGGSHRPGILACSSCLCTRCSLGHSHGERWLQQAASFIW